MTKRRQKKKNKPSRRLMRKAMVWTISAALVGAACVYQRTTDKELPPQVEEVVKQAQVVVEKAREEVSHIRQRVAEAQSSNAPTPAQASTTKGMETSAQPTTAKGMETPAIRPMDTRVMRRTGYTVSFNDEWLMPNWVAWELTPERVDGKVKRSDIFTPDPHLPEKLRVEHRDYSRSGYDRGHMAPAGDMKWDELAMQESFYMSNMCPQAPNLNKGDWKELEEACRKWTQQHRTSVYIACGPIVEQGKRHKRIGQSYKVTVPDAFFKVVMKLGKRPSAVGFIFPNDDCNAPLADYAIPVDSVEKITGIDFFPQLPDEQENALEATIGMKNF